MLTKFRFLTKHLDTHKFEGFCLYKSELFSSLTGGLHNILSCKAKYHGKGLYNDFQEKNLWGGKKHSFLLSRSFWRSNFADVCNFEDPLFSSRKQHSSFPPIAWRGNTGLSLPLCQQWHLPAWWHLPDLP